jgi:hypothetical protein
MESCYIPPHLRKNPAPAAEPDALLNPAELSAAIPSSNSQGRSGEDLYTIQELHAYFWGEGAACEDVCNTTLHSSEGNPKSLSWVLLFNGANPKWNDDGVIYVKSNLDLLPAITVPSETQPVIAVAAPKQLLDEPGEEGGVMLPTNSKATDEDRDQGPPNGMQNPTATEPSLRQPKETTVTNHSPIAVFSQPIRHVSRSFKFVGWYKIDHIQILEPLSRELADMLLEKWEEVDKYGYRLPPKRSFSIRLKSVYYKWAVLRMKEDEEATRGKGKPNIERHDQHEGTPEESEGRSFNDMLADMGLEDGNREEESKEKDT